MSLPKLNKNQTLKCEGAITECELVKALTSMDNDKSPGNDGITKEFYVKFWDVVKEPLCASVRQSFITGELSTSQKQAIIKVIEKKDRDKRFIKNWRPISLLNVDMKLISKVLASRLKNVISSIVNENQVAYVNNRFISESGRLISDVLEITNSLNIEGLLMTVDIEKAFDSINHSFLICVLKKFGFGNDFQKWIQILMKNTQSCVINGGYTTPYFKLERGTRQGDPISAYLFTIALEVVFSLIKENPDIEGLNFFSHAFLYSAYADDTTFFLRNESATEVIKTFDKFSLFSGLKINYEKCEIGGIGIKKGVKMALCGMNCIDLTEDLIKILGIYFSYKTKLELKKNLLNHIAKIQNILKLWKLRNLTIEGRIVVFKSLAISKLIHLALLTEIPTTSINLLTKIQIEFIWKGKNPKIKNSTLCNGYEYGGLKNVDIFSKVVSLQCSWIKRLFDYNFHQWKIIPLYLFRQYLGKKFKFHSNLQVSHSILSNFPKFYKEIFIRWGKHLASPATLPSTVACQFIWYNKHIQIDNKSIYLHNFSNRNLNFVGQLFDTDGKLKPWESVKQQFFS